MSPEDLKALCERHPSCATCVHRGERTYSRGRKKTTHTWCDLHNRAVEYLYFKDEKGKDCVAGDVPCDQYTYARREFSPRVRDILANRPSG